MPDRCWPIGLSHDGMSRKQLPDPVSGLPWDATLRSGRFAHARVEVRSVEKNLARLDSNQEFQDQNLVCCRYTTGYRSRTVPRQLPGPVVPVAMPAG